jgi:hypothetical protein
MNTDTPETHSAYIQRPNEGAWDFRVRQEKTMERLERERDEARETLATVTAQRDRLEEALKELRNNESLSLGGAAYEIVEQALQSLTLNAKP